MDTTKLNVDIVHDDKYSVFNRFSKKKIKKRKFYYYNHLTKLNPANTNV